MSHLSWLNPTPHAIAVYASRPASPPEPRATLATKRALLLTWAGLAPAGSHQLRPGALIRSPHQRGRTAMADAETERLGGLEVDQRLVLVGYSSPGSSPFRMRPAYCGGESGGKSRATRRAVCPGTKGSMKKLGCAPPKLESRGQTSEQSAAN